jgi:hypothetical protein
VSAITLPSSTPLAIPPVNNGPQYIANGRSSPESSVSAGPNSASMTRSVRQQAGPNPSRSAAHCRRHSRTATSP